MAGPKWSRVGAELNRDRTLWSGATHRGFYSEPLESCSSFLFLGHAMQHTVS